MANPRYKATSASETSIGFDYQFYYYFYLLLDLRISESIGIELQDDIHVELADGSLILIQTKHTVQSSASGANINLTERDADLWKTLSNWVKVLNEESDFEKFIKNTSFQLVSNKSLGINNFYINLIKFQNKEITIKDFLDYLDQLTVGTVDETIKSYMSILKKLSRNQLTQFLLRLKFGLNEDDLVLKIKQRLLEKIYLPEKIDDVYNCLFSELKAKEYLDIKKGDKKVISFEQFTNDFKGCFRKGLSNKLPLREFKPALPDKYDKQGFIMQLIDIGDISSRDNDEMIAYTTQMLQLYNNLKKWEDDGELLSQERQKFDSESVLIWKNSFRSKFREIKNRIENGIAVDQTEIKYKAIECLDEMRQAILTIDETMLTHELSNGHFYLLTENNMVGWHYDWKKRY